MRTESEANQAMHARAIERARWAAVLGAKPVSRPAVRRSFWSLLFGL